MPTDSPVEERPSRGVLVRDLILFQLKLWLDGLKDIVLSPLSIVGGLIDLLRSPTRPSLFYTTLQWGERFDLWLNLYDASARAETRSSGLVGDDGDDSVTRPLEMWARFISNEDNSNRATTKLIQEGDYVAEVRIEWEHSDGARSPHRAVKNADVIGRVRQALRHDDLNEAAQHARIYKRVPEG